VEDQVPVSIWPSYTSRHWPTVEVFDPAST
jgi:hypothetical protein